MADPRNIRTLFVVLTAGCNLSCSYCFQNDKKQRRMGWDTLRSSLEWALTSRQPDVEVVFFGGEPLLEFPLIQKAVRYLEKHKSRAAGRIIYGMVTNGTLLKGERLDFVAHHRFETQLSFDGVAPAQNVRGPGTFAVLDRALDDIRELYPDFFYENLKIALTFQTHTLKYLADSVDYFLEKGIQRFTLSPDFTASSKWKVERLHELEEQFERIYQSSIAHFDATGEVPFLGFSEGDEDSPHKPKGLSMCGVMRGETPTVDVDGEVHGCATFTESYQSFPRAFLKDRIADIRLGQVESPEFNERYAGFEEAIRGTEIFDNKQDKYSSYGNCGDCEFLSECSVCPMSIGHIPGNTDPRRVPDFPCAVNLVSLRYRKQFLARTSPFWLLSGLEEPPEAIRLLQEAGEPGRSD